jgi:ubiquinone/menaquinone biosynthesis C-methylase UbiE
MGSDPPATPDDEMSSSSASITFTSQAYDATNDEDATRAASDWLEAQALHPFIREVAQRTLVRLALQPGEAILEVGCGTGVFLPSLAALVGPTGRVAAIDHAPAFLEQARERLNGAGLADRVELAQADAHRLPFAGATFDAAHCERVLMHLEDPARAIREMRRVVRPGGRVVVAEVQAAGATIAHPDPAAARQINAVLVSGMKNVEMGINLRRHFVEAGLEQVGGEVVAFFEEELDQEEAEEFTRIARDLAASGALEPGRAEAAIAAMEDNRTRGTHCGLALIFIVSGRVPDGDRDGD